LEASAIPNVDKFNVFRSMAFPWYDILFDMFK
jgi:hypothetical protein